MVIRSFDTVNIYSDINYADEAVAAFLSQTGLLFPCCPPLPPWPEGPLLLFDDPLPAPPLPLLPFTYPSAYIIEKEFTFGDSAIVFRASHHTYRTHRKLAIIIDPEAIHFRHSELSIL